MAAHQRRLSAVLCGLSASPSAAAAPPEEYRASNFVDFSEDLAAPGPTAERLEHFYREGWLIIDDFIGSPWIPALREAGRRITEACAPEIAYTTVDTSKGYIHRAQEDEPWALRGLEHPAFGQPVFSEFKGSEEFLSFCDSWCTGGLKPEDAGWSAGLLWCNPRKHEMGPSWHRDTTWWGEGKSYFAQKEIRGDTPADYTDEVERRLWKGIRETNKKIFTERSGVSMFLALTDDECHEVVRTSHDRYRTPFEHDVILPQAMKDAGVAFTPSWDKKSPLPGGVSCRLKAGQALIRNGTNIHTGHTVPGRERCTLAIGMSRFAGVADGAEPQVLDVRSAWSLDPAIRDALPHEWQKVAWDRHAVASKLGDALEDRYPGFDIDNIKRGVIKGWDTELERRAAAAGEKWLPFMTLETAGEAGL